MSNVFRGSWIPEPVYENAENPILFRCPFCGAAVSMTANIATYPTCPFCLTDMPEAEEFETPTELIDAKNGNKAVTAKTYSADEYDRQVKINKKREYYKRNKEKIKAYQREYYAEHKDKLLEGQRKRYAENPEDKKARSCRYRAEHKAEINEYTKEWRRNNPDKVREYQIRARGKPMREVTAHIMGIPVEDVPETGFKFGKGVTT